MTAGLLAGTATRPLLFAWTVPAGAPLRHSCPACDTPARAAVRLLAPPRGRCAACRTPWSADHGLPEAMTALVFALIAASGLTGWIAAAHYWTAACGMALILIDAKVNRLPNVLTIPAFAGVIVLLVGAAANGEHGSVLRSLAAAATLGATFFLMTFGGIGLGDVKLAPTLGALLGWHSWAGVFLGTFAMFALAVGGFCTFQPVVDGGECPRKLDCEGCDRFVMSGADLLYWHRKREQWGSMAERAPDDKTADYLHSLFEPTGQAIDGLEKALAALGLLDEALALDLRRPQDYFGRIWSTAFRATDLAAAADDGLLDEWTGEEA